VSQQINLFSPIFLTQKKYFSAVTMAQGLGLVVLGSLLFFAYVYFQNAGLGKQAADTTRRLAQEQSRLERIGTEYAPRAKSRLLQQEIERAEAELKARGEVLQTISGLWLTGFSIKGNDMEIRGRALQADLVPAYIQGLKRETVMQGKAFATLQMALPKAEATGKDVPAAAPRYVEFTLQSSEPGGAK
jgi:hypothetical protein